MLFNSFEFIFLFFPVVLAISLRLRGQWLLSWITLTSYVFYALFGHLWFLIPMFITTLLDFTLAQWIEKSSSSTVKRCLLYFSLTGNLGLLIYFKYAGLFAETGQQLMHFLGIVNDSSSFVLRVVVPAGISFYTFQTMSYVLDVHRGKGRAETNFWRFAAFVSFFPHLVAGPLTRHDQLIPQLTRISCAEFKPRWEEGVYLFSLGLMKKVLLGDQLGKFVDLTINSPDRMGFLGGWAALLGFGLQIYFDFSGYCDMAVGLGRLFDIELPRNFNSPYQALNPADFWHRWHITLSLWFRDYVYIPLGGNRSSSNRHMLNILTTMALAGLWHGASWNFVLWGFYQGILLVFYHQFSPVWDRKKSIVQKTATFLAILLGWTFFRAKYMYVVILWWGALLGTQGWGFSAFGPMEWSAFILLLGYGLIIVFRLPNAVSFPSFPQLPPLWKAALGFLTAATLLLANYSSKFLYFQF